ncbi:MAG TPA: sensor histidine kinase [Actinocrinis sp.]|jgi:anti-sigma regulatory factor (Ser/Thr protein kinase)|uniref:sensor histidine kinase n=1 Tax=Actinocrinis sp. TaxID=1920516 RepID=UPI002DDCB22B|nr:sensor histidine kinase [Actinocrinis sp.]HEV3170935.1 sensor histidine kinase [Actinocrinis sp.]
MNTSAPSPAKSAEPPGDAFRHDALLYAGDEQFVESVGAFVRDGLARGQPTLVAVIEPRASLLRDALGADARAVEFLAMREVGRNPARIIPAWQRWTERNEGSRRGFRGVGEPVWADRTQGELVECQLHEQLLNTAFQDGPAWWLLCPYDTSSLPAPVIERAYQAHPGVLVGGVARQSTSYRHPGLSVPTTFAEPLPEPDAGAVRYEAAFGLDQLPQLRQDLAACAAVSGLGRQRTQDLVLVASELAANSIRHGGGRGVLRLWRDGSHVVCEVRDRGLVTDALIGRRHPDLVNDLGAGLWIANQLCDLVQIRSAPAMGTVVRVRLAETSP